MGMDESSRGLLSAFLDAVGSIHGECRTPVKVCVLPGYRSISTRPPSVVRKLPVIRGAGYASDGDAFFWAKAAPTTAIISNTQGSECRLVKNIFSSTHLFADDPAAQILRAALREKRPRRHFRVAPLSCRFAQQTARGERCVTRTMLVASRARAIRAQAAAGRHGRDSRRARSSGVYRACSESAGARRSDGVTERAPARCCRRAYDARP